MERLAAEYRRVGGGKNPKATAVIVVAADYPEAELEQGEASWIRRLDLNARWRRERRSGKVSRKLPPVDPLVLLRAIEREKTESEARKKIRIEQQRLALKETLRQQREQKRKELIEQDLIRKQERFQMEKDIKSAKARAWTHDVPADKPTRQSVNLLDDIKWVYENLAHLVLVSVNERGLEVRQLDPALLSQAPSKGAIAMATYAMQKPEGFIEKFAVKLLPRDAEPSEIESDVIEAMDPDFANLDGYMGASDGTSAS